MDSLNITNGSNSVELMKAAGISGDKISWDDILHEGPVPHGLTLRELSAIRASFISQLGWGNADEIQQKFTNRDELLEKSAEYAKIVLWFEHDLYDQLQLAQILDWFHQQVDVQCRLSLIGTGKHLGRHTPQEIAALKSTDEIVSDRQLQLASDIWNAFTASDPQSLNELLKQDLSELPYMKCALLRLAEEYPSIKSGLPQTEKLVLEALLDGAMSPSDLFRAYQHLEQAEFMGDSTFWVRLNQMAFCHQPLVALQIIEPISYPLNPEQKIIVTDYAKQVLAGQIDWFSVNKLSKFIGGCEVNQTNRWRWNADRKQLELKK